MAPAKAGQDAQGCALIQQASAALAGGVENDELRLLLIRRLSEHGLLARAWAVAQHLSEAVRTHPDFSRLAAALDVRHGGGRVDWSRFAAGFQANLAAIAERYAWADEIAAAWQREERHLELHAARALGWQVFDTRRGPTYGWRPAFVDHRPQKPAEVLRAELINGEALSPLVLDGVGMGEHLPWVYEASRDPRTGQAAAIYQIEGCWLALAVALHLADWTDLVSDPRVRLCCGPDSLAQFERAVAADAWNQPPREIFLTPPWDTCGSQTQDCVRRILDEYTRDQGAVRAKVQEAYRGRDPAWWGRRYAAALAGEGPPLCVLGITCRFTTVLKYSMRDALNALQANGCETRCLIEPNDYSGLNRGQLMFAVRDFEPDLVLMIDHTREQILPGVDVPFLTWVQDRLPALFNRKAGSAQGPLDFCMGFSRKVLCGLYGYPAERFLASEMATDPAALLPPRFSADGQTLGALRAAPAPRYACDLAYATNCFDSPEEFHARLRRAARLDSGVPLRPLLDELYEELRARQARCELDGGTPWVKLVRGAEEKLGARLAPAGRLDLAEAFVRPLADRMLRLEALEWAARWAEETGRRFHLYGKGWERHAKFARYARGYVEHGPELGAAFRSAQVNLHTGANASFHQRVLDCLAAGGFLLIRKHAYDRSTGRSVPEDIDISGVAGGEDGSITPGDFWPELEQVTFSTYDELAARLEYSLSCPDKRWAIADAMRTRMLGVFSYRSVTAHLLKWLAACLTSRQTFLPRRQSGGGGAPPPHPTAGGRRAPPRPKPPRPAHGGGGGPPGRERSLTQAHKSMYTLVHGQSLQHFTSNAKAG
jgi:hypothetical protein